LDVNKQIRMAVKTGKVEFGSKVALSSASLGRAKLLILASNCPKDFRENIVYDAEQSEVPVYVFQGSSLDLGALCYARNPSQLHQWSLENLEIQKS
jgi:large subunit ribosomal protein L30e